MRIELFPVLLPEGRDAFILFAVDSLGMKHYQFSHLIYKYQNYFYYRISKKVILTGKRLGALRAEIEKALNNDPDVCSRIATNLEMDKQEVSNWLALQFDFE